MKIKNNAKGFTLIELLIVISIIGILTTLIAANFSSAQARGRDSKRKSDLQNIAAALELYYNDANKYPASGTSNGQLSISTTSTKYALKDTTGTNTYMKEVPTDPRYGVTGFEYKYCVDTTAYKKYTLYTNLENDRDVARFCNTAGATAWSSVACDSVGSSGSNCSSTDISTKDYSVSEPF